MEAQTSPKAASMDQAQVQAQHPPAPPSLPSAAAPPSNPPTSSSKPIWPDGHLLFLDPLSDSVIPKIVQILSKFTYENPPRQTSILSEATRIVIDPTSTFGDAVLQHQARQQPPGESGSSRPPQLLVTAEWLKECIFWEEWLDEGKFLFVRAEGKERGLKGGGGSKGKGREVEMEKAEMDDESDEDESDSPPDLPSSGRWLRSEDDALARYLLPPEEDYSALDKNGRNAFDRFALTELTRRTGPALRERFRVNEIELKARIEVLKNGDGAGRTRRESMASKGKGKERASEESSSPDHDTDDGEEDHGDGTRGRGTGSGIRDPYTDQEELDLKSCLQSTSSAADAFRKMSALHPRRTANGVGTHYYKHKDRYEGLLLPPVEQEEKSARLPYARPDAWTAEEDGYLVKLLSEPHSGYLEFCKTFHAKYPDRTVCAIKTRYFRNRLGLLEEARKLKDRSSSSSKLPTPGSSRSHPNPPPSSSKRSLDKVDGPSSSSSSSKQPRRQFSSSLTPSPVASGSNSNQQPPHPHQQSLSPSPLSDTNSSSSEADSEFEPPSFLQLGVPPSALSPTSPSCYWCGTGEDESSYFKMLELAEEDPSDPEKMTRVNGRLACSFCVERTEKWVAREESEEMGELERLTRLGRKLEVTGRKERATLVRVEEGGTARED